MILSADGVCAIDGRVLIKPSKVLSPYHLVISPYPNQYEITTTSREGVPLFVRPIKPEDAPLLLDLFDSLSQESVYYRFFSPLKTLSHKMLVVFTQIDYDQDMALVAMDASESEEKILGVSRLMRKPGGMEAEFAVVVRDAWQGKGIGATLMKNLLFIAEKQSLDTVWGTILPRNRQMVKLAGKLGFEICSNPGEETYEVRIDLKKRKP